MDFAFPAQFLPPDQPDRLRKALSIRASADVCWYRERMAVSVCCRRAQTNSIGKLGKLRIELNDGYKQTQRMAAVGLRTSFADCPPAPSPYSHHRYLRPLPLPSRLPPIGPPAGHYHSSNMRNFRHLIKPPQKGVDIHPNGHVTTSACSVPRDHHSSLLTSDHPPSLSIRFPLAPAPGRALKDTSVDSWMQVLSGFICMMNSL